MANKNLFVLIFLFMCVVASAQQDTITLTEVIVSDTQLRDFSQTQSVQKLSDSVIGRSGASLTSLLVNNSLVYFKENGPGMVSSPSFRGTSAQQTAVVWNGININSQLNGQTDFNTLNARDFNEVSVRAGGGSVIYGSSAIGGSIHLDNSLVFTNRFVNEVRTDYGSFATMGANYKVMAGNERFSVNASVSHNKSDNDYKYPGYDVYNTNGQYHNTSLNAALGYKLTDNHILRFYSYLFDGQRHFSGTLAAPSSSMYDDTNTRNLVEWTALYGKFTGRLKAAYLEEHYKYYENYTNDSYTTGRVKSMIARYDVTYDFTPNLKLNAIADLTHNDGEGSDIKRSIRNTASGALLLKHSITEALQYEAGLRKESGNAYSSPLLFSAGARVKVSDFYAVKVNGSRNFRAPTFNDLYWEGSGNPNLKPESSYQAEVGNVFTKGTTMLSLTGYYIRLTDMLRWVPGVGGIWRPENVDKAKSYGSEAVFSWDKKFGQHTFSLNANYAYTISQKDGNKNQMMYVPKNRVTATLAYAVKRFSAYYRHLFTGEVFYTTDNSSGIDAYNVSGAGAEYTFNVAGGLSLGFQVNNLYSAEYMNVAVRPMPGRNYNAYLNFKF